MLFAYYHLQYILRYLGLMGLECNLNRLEEASVMVVFFFQLANAVALDTCRALEVDMIIVFIHDFKKLV